MRNRAISVGLLVSALGAWGSGTLRTPLIGFIHDANGSVRPVSGVRGNFLLGESVLDGARSVAFSDMYGLVKTDQDILVLNTEASVMDRIPGSGGDALFGFDRLGTPAAAYLSDTNTLCRIVPGGASDCRRLDIEGDVVGLTVDDPDLLKLAVRRTDGVWLVSIREQDRALLAEHLLLGVALPLLLLPEGALLYSDGEALVIRTPRGAETRIEAPVRPVAFEQMGRNWVRLRGGEGRPSWALHLGEQAVEAYCLPQDQQ